MQLQLRGVEDRRKDAASTVAAGAYIPVPWFLPKALRNSGTVNDTQYLSKSEVCNSEGVAGEGQYTL